MADLDTDWRVVGKSSCAWFGASSHVQAASLVGRIVEFLPDGAPLPDLDVRADGVRVGVNGLEAESAGAVLQVISDAARTVGLAADPSVPQEVRLRVDSPAPASVMPFRRTALDCGDVDADTIGDRWRRCPVIRFEQSDRTGPLRNRLHVDAGPPGSDRRVRGGGDGRGRPRRLHV